MSTVDSRIVTMKFDNSAFQRGVSSTLDILGKLKTALTGIPSKDMLSGITSSANKVDMTNVGDQADGIARKFSAMSVVAVTALATVAHQAVQTGLGLANSVTFAPITSGLKEYETNLNSIQTIMSNTSGEGLKDVTGALEELNRYSDQTIYNFSEMARNIGTFTAAGVDLDTSVAAIKGIANLAAVSGSNSQQASTAMYQLSQALSTGTVKLMDWNSVVNAGMGGKVFQNALKQTAEVQGVAIDDIIKKNGSFRDSLQEGWLTADILNETLMQFAGDLSAKQLENRGYTQAQIKDILKMGREATDAATKVKTLSQLIGTLQEAAGSGWAKTWQLIFGDFNQAKKLWTNVNEVLGGMITESADRRNKLFHQWNRLGGREVLIEALSNAFQALMNVLKPIGQAFRDVFPATTARSLYDITVSFREFTEGLVASKGTMKDIRTIFGAVFGVLGVGAEIVKGLVRYVLGFFGLLASGTGGVIDFSASLLEVVESLTQWILKGDYIAKFFDKIIEGRAAVLGPIIKAFGDLLHVLAGLVGTGVDVAIDGIVAGFEYLMPILERVRDYLIGVGDSVRVEVIDAFNKLKPILENVKDSIESAFGSINVGDSVSGALGGLAGLFNIGNSTDTAKKGIGEVRKALSSTSSVTETAKEHLSGFKDFLQDVGGVFQTIGGWIWFVLQKIGDGIVVAFEAIGGSTDSLLSDIGNIVTGIWNYLSNTISNLNYGKIIVLMNTALMAAIGGGFARFAWNFGSMFKDFRGIFQSVGGVFEQLGDNLKTMQKDVRANIIMKIAVALAILAASLYVLSRIDGKALAMSLGALTAMLTMLVVSLKLLEKSMPDESGLKEALRLGALSTVLLGLGVALLAMSAAVYILGQMSPEELKKGLIAISTMLGGIIIATAVLNKTGGAASIVQASIAIGILAFALTAFAGAVKLYSALDTDMLKDGGMKIAAMLIGLGVAMHFLPGARALAGAAALFVVANALVVLSGALKILASMDSGDSWQSILTLAGAMMILVAAANAMSGAVMGAVAIGIMTAALALLIPQLMLMGQMSWESIGKGLAMLAGVFVVIGLAGLILAPIVPVIYALGVAVAMIGVGLLAAGAGMMLFGIGLTALATSGAAATVVLIDVINTFLDAIPGFINRFGKALGAAAKLIQRQGPAFVRAGSAIIEALLKSVIKNVPLIGKAMRVLLAEAFKTLRAAVPDMIRTGFVILNAFLDGLNRNIGRITRTAVSIIVKFLNGISDGMDRIAKAGVRLVITFVTAVAKEIGNQGSKLLDAAKGMAGDLIDGLTSGIAAGIDNVEQAVRNLAGKIPGPIKKLLGIDSPSKVFRQFGRWTAEGLALGIDDETERTARSAEELGHRTISAIRESLDRVSDAVVDDINTTIKPVLDLSQVEADARKIGSLIQGQPVMAGVSLADASAISLDQMAAAEAAAAGGATGSSEFKFEQTNISPKPLDPVEVYRNTKSLISLAKEALQP